MSRKSTSSSRGRRGSRGGSASNETATFLNNFSSLLPELSDISVTSDQSRLITVRKQANLGPTVRLHEVFVGADETVMHALADFVEKKSASSVKVIKGFLKSNRGKLLGTSGKEERQEERRAAAEETEAQENKGRSARDRGAKGSRKRGEEKARAQKETQAAPSPQDAEKPGKGDEQAGKGDQQASGRRKGSKRGGAEAEASRQKSADGRGKSSRRGQKDAAGDDMAGKYFNLQEIFDVLNEQYFDNSVKAKIEWGKKSAGPSPKSFEPGVYSEKSRTIRIRPRLDQGFVPPYFTEGVVYHQMLHIALAPKKVNGRTIRHTPEFRRRLETYRRYNQMKRWEDKNLDKLLL